jgi:hypothetical protein
VRSLPAATAALELLVPELNEDERCLFLMILQAADAAVGIDSQNQVVVTLDSGVATLSGGRHERLAEKLASRITKLPDGPQAAAMWLLAEASNALAMIGSSSPSAAPAALCAATGAIQNLRPSGILYVGEASFLSPTAFWDARSEAVRLSVNASDLHGQRLATAGNVGRQIHMASDTIRFISRHAGQCAPSGNAAYLYYDRMGDHIRPHLDRDLYSLHCLVMLHHQYGDEGRSAFLVVERDGMRRIELEPGHCVVFFGAGSVHGRSSVQSGEQVQLLSLGFTSPR